jgi:rifampin ADP-ribosylating transferase
LPQGSRDRVRGRLMYARHLRSYRSTAPLRVIGEVTDWTRLTPEELQGWKDRLTAILVDERGEIIN